MSEDEKACQIGTAALALQRAREDLALIEGRLGSVMSAYRAALDAAESSDLTVTSGKVAFRGLSASPANLLNESQLGELLDSRQSARDRVEQTKRQLTSFGITAI